jgi:hypothetical protein
MKYFYYSIIVLVLLCFHNNSSAQIVFVKSDSVIATYDSLGLYLSAITDSPYVSSKQKIISVRSANKSLAQAEAKNDLKAKSHALLTISDAYIAYGNNKKAFSYLIRSLKAKDDFDDDIAVAHIYYNLAIVLSRLKQYPAALKCFYKTGYVYQQTNFKSKRKQISAIDTSASLSRAELYGNAVVNENAASIIFSDSLVDGSLLSIDTTKLINNPLLEDSPSTDYENLLDAFYDDKPAFAYAVMLHIKQPISGRSDVFTRISKVGHTFITLIKFNIDSTVVSKSFGFYPLKDNILSATPLLPSTNSEIKNDSLHDWDETIGKFITAQKFEQILDFVDEASPKRYNLNKNNCTDFGLHIANMAGITITTTRSNWPLGKGNNPATTGQSILKGKFINTDTQNQHGLFACSNNLFIHRIVAQ